MVESSGVKRIDLGDSLTSSPSESKLGAYVRHTKKNERNLTLANRGRSNGPLCHSVVLPRKPRREFRKNLFDASAIPVAEPEGSTTEIVVASIKSRPPSGIMFAVFRAVKQFPALLTLFSLEFYS